MKSLSVLHINTWGGIGGAFIASDRLHQGLVDLGIDSTLAYGKIFNNSDSSLKASKTYKKLEQPNKFERVLSKGCKKIGLNDIGNISSLLLAKKDYFNRASILNFHNLHSDYFSYLALPNLTEDKAAVWTLHDMWSFTGHCAYSYDCSRWQTGCGKCPYPNSQPAVERDATHLEWKIKSWIYSRFKLTIVAPSVWLTEQARQSMLNRFPIYHIPYGIDTNVYQPLEKEQCRTLLGLPVGKKVLMFGAQSLTDRRKGSDLLLKALSCLPKSLKAEIVLLTIGDDSTVSIETLGINTFNLGYIGSDRLKAIAYSSADLFVFPTRADNLPLVLQESMACGTPMVSFNAGGVSDLVRPGITGYLAEPENAQDFSTGIVKLLEDQNLRNHMSQQCRAIALAEYSLQLQAQQYINLYHQLLIN
ncbi:glycosyltransferase family 4 protein [Chlorogloea sp. CCALA 695]|uniref:glycosyltransferase family 4 protein n=1 Tax=Chlorogloea sp. CCALA 695 TaxID=2107693 RepID=UPI000D074DD5|nr:glycosyltransferase family 4 protein [Chlorogloea sp. CCALA 695]PSB32752.1 glycosyl transferase [Chlorogloea sp. CCALA 695]